MMIIVSIMLRVTYLVIFDAYGNEIELNIKVQDLIKLIIIEPFFSYFHREKVYLKYFSYIIFQFFVNKRTNN